jgi:hypothetical protein
MTTRRRWFAVVAAVVVVLGGCDSQTKQPAAESQAPPVTPTVADAPSPPEETHDPPGASGDPSEVPVIDESAYVSGGFAADGAGGEGTVGYGWVDDSGSVVGHITVDHLVRDTSTADGAESDHVDFTPTDNFPMPANPKVSVLKTTGNVDVALIGPVDDNLAPVVELSDGTRLTVTDYAEAGGIVPGQRVCHSGQNAVTVTLHEVCGEVVHVGSTSHCLPDNGSSTCVVSVRTDRGDGFAGDHGDSGAAAYTYNANGTITLVGTFKSSGDGMAQLEPTYAAMEAFGGHPYTTMDIS